MHRSAIVGVVGLVIVAASLSGYELRPSSDNWVLPDTPAAQASAAAPRAPAAPAGRQVFYDMNEMAWQGDAHAGGPSRRKVVLGEHVTFNMTELTPGPMKGPRPAGHHHDYEQVLVGLKGIYEQAVGPDNTCRIGPMTACVEPFNVPHSVVGYPEQEGKVLTIEFIPIARTELLPPFTPVTWPKSPEPKQIPKGFKFFADFNVMPWIGEQGGPQFKALIGQTCSLVLWRLPASSLKGTGAAGPRHTVELVSYVLEGHAEARLGDETRRIGPGSMMLIPADVEHRSMTAVNNEDVLLLEFQPAVRQDLLKQMEKP